MSSLALAFTTLAMGALDFGAQEVASWLTFSMRYHLLFLVPFYRWELVANGLRTSPSSCSQNSHSTLTVSLHQSRLRNWQRQKKKKKTLGSQELQFGRFRLRYLFISVPKKAGSQSMEARGPATWKMEIGRIEFGGQPGQKVSVRHPLPCHLNQYARSGGACPWSWGTLGRRIRKIIAQAPWAKTWNLPEK
jgi:hypothetical protein